MANRVALDTGELRALVAALSDPVSPAPVSDDTLALVRIYFYISNALVVPTVSREVDPGGEAAAIRWRNFHFDELPEKDQFLVGCVKGMANRYLDYHPDPRDCHAVAEAECAKVEAFLTTNGALIKGLGGRAESIQVTSPSEYWEQVRPPRGAAPRITPAQDNPLAAVDWWRW